jgi:hypothetical protein
MRERQYRFPSTQNTRVSFVTLLRHQLTGVPTSALSSVKT